MTAEWNRSFFEKPADDRLRHLAFTLPSRIRTGVYWVSLPSAERTFSLASTCRVPTLASTDPSSSSGRSNSVEVVEKVPNCKSRRPVVVGSRTGVERGWRVFTIEHTRVRFRRLLGVGRVLCGVRTLARLGTRDRVETVLRLGIGVDDILQLQVGVDDILCHLVRRHRIQYVERLLEIVGQSSNCSSVKQLNAYWVTACELVPSNSRFRRGSPPRDDRTYRSERPHNNRTVVEAVRSTIHWGPGASGDDF